MNRCLHLALIAALLGPPSSPAWISETDDAELELGIRQARRGAFDEAVLTLDRVVRRLEEDPTRSADLGRAYVYLSVAYLELGQEEKARDHFVQGLVADPAISLTAREFPPKLLQFFDRVRAEIVPPLPPAPPPPAPEPQVPATAGPRAAPSPGPATPARPAARKGGFNKLVLLLGGAAAAGIAAAAAAGGSNGQAATSATPMPGPSPATTPAPTPTTDSRTLTFDGWSERNPQNGDCRYTTSSGSDFTISQPSRIEVHIVASPSNEAFTLQIVKWEGTRGNVEAQQTGVGSAALVHTATAAGSYSASVLIAPPQTGGCPSLRLTWTATVTITIVG